MNSAVSPMAKVKYRDIPAPFLFTKSLVGLSVFISEQAKVEGVHGIDYSEVELPVELHASLALEHVSSHVMLSLLNDLGYSSLYFPGGSVPNQARVAIGLTLILTHSGVLQLAQEGVHLESREAYLGTAKRLLSFRTEEEKREHSEVGVAAFEMFMNVEKERFVALRDFLIYEHFPNYVRSWLMPGNEKLSHALLTSFRGAFEGILEDNQ